MCALCGAASSSTCLLFPVPGGAELATWRTFVQVLQRIEPGSEQQGSGGGHCDAVLGVDAHPCEPLLASAGHAKDRTVKLWRSQ